MKDQVGGIKVRRRRSWYRRRLRMQRGLLAVVAMFLVTVIAGQGAARLFAHFQRTSKTTTDSVQARAGFRPQFSTSDRPKSLESAAASERVVYPYSVVPGGVYSSDELRQAMQHDRVVWQHYYQFQLRHARLVRATQARTVYLSYRLRNRIFWTRKRFHLHVGELLLTDGNITARARCGNQVSETPKPEVSEEEPTEDVLDRPVSPALRMPSLPIYSALVPPSLPAADPLSPTGPMAFNHGLFLFPYVPFGVPLPPRLQGVCETPSQEQSEQGDDEKSEKVCPPHRRKTPVVPEPSTWVLIASGLAVVFWSYWRSNRRLPTLEPPQF